MHGCVFSRGFQSRPLILKEACQGAVEINGDRGRPWIKLRQERASQCHVDPLLLGRRGSNWAHGVVVSHPLRMRKALGSNPSVSIAMTGLAPIYITCMKRTDRSNSHRRHRLHACRSHPSDSALAAGPGDRASDSRLCPHAEPGTPLDVGVRNAASGLIPRHPPSSIGRSGARRS